jgi:hypothetical protein
MGKVLTGDFSHCERRNDEWIWGNGVCACRLLQRAFRC